MSRSIHVAVGLIRSGGRILLCQRSAEAKYPLKWEFPGGKVEQGETPEGALERELSEELSIDARTGRLYHRETSAYPDHGLFAVDYFFVDEWSGEPRNNVFADLRWVLPAEILELDILEGNREVCRRLAAGEDI
jgi:8-oxo-dGTP diphosphatase